MSDWLELFKVAGSVLGVGGAAKVLDRYWADRAARLNNEAGRIGLDSQSIADQAKLRAELFGWVQEIKKENAEIKSENAILRKRVDSLENDLESARELARVAQLERQSARDERQAARDERETVAVENQKLRIRCDSLEHELKEIKFAMSCEQEHRETRES